MADIDRDYTDRTRAERERARAVTSGGNAGWWIGGILVLAVLIIGFIALSGGEPAPVDTPPAVESTTPTPAPITPPANETAPLTEPTPMTPAAPAVDEPAPANNAAPEAAPATPAPAEPAPAAPAPADVTPVQ